MPFQRSVNFLNDVEQWEDENNEIVKVAKEMSNKLNDMAQFARNQGLQAAGSIKVSIKCFIILKRKLMPK